MALAAVNLLAPLSFMATEVIGGELATVYDPMFMVVAMAIPMVIPMAGKVAGWTLNHMWDDRGFFYYRVLRLCTIRTSYMRWTQAWMLLALATLLESTIPQNAELGPAGAAAARTEA